MTRAPKSNPLKWMFRGDDSPTFKRMPRSALVKWMLEHPGVWDGYPKPFGHSQFIFDMLKNAGLFSPRSQCNTGTITKLVEAARAAQRLNEREA